MSCSKENALIQVKIGRKWVTVKKLIKHKDRVWDTNIISHYERFVELRIQFKKC